MQMVGQPEISVVIPTYNRSELLRHTLLSVLEQDAKGLIFEVIVVDNNSTDESRALVESFIAREGGRLRYFFEPRQGNAYARNTGIERSQAPIIAFVDDDVIVEPNWLNTIKRTFDQHPEKVFIGGKILPSFNETPPPWLTRDHWSPIAALDYGQEQLLLSNQNPLCLLTANIAFRREVFAEVSNFSPVLQRVKNGIGSLEDHDFLLRVMRSGRSGLYVPSMIVTTRVSRERTTKKYHRRWHTGHGRFYAIMRDPEWERSKTSFLDVPSHLYKRTAWDSMGWLKNTLLGRREEAFLLERQLRFFHGFFLQRQRGLFRSLRYRSTPSKSSEAAQDSRQ